MLNKNQMLIFILLSGFIGGCAMLGIINIALIFATLAQGGAAPTATLILAIFAVGAIGTVGTLRILHNRFQSNLKKRLGLDD